MQPSSLQVHEETPCLYLLYRNAPIGVKASSERRPATSTPTSALSPFRGMLFAHMEKVAGCMVPGKRECPCRAPLRMEEQRIMADQRALGNPDRSPAEVGAQARDRAQEASAQVRDKAHEMVHQGEETASAYYQQGRQQMAAVEHTLEDGIRAKPLQSVFIAAGMGMLLGLVLKR
jgi:ElaB/YqjD/DUF883 family membrane-anchored ribosome-binding protein